MLFSLVCLQHYLRQQFGILPEHIWLDTRFRQDLHLTKADMDQLISFVSQTTGLDFTEGMIQNLTDVFDLLVHVLLRSQEINVTVAYFDSLGYLESSLDYREFRPFGAALLQQMYLN